MFWTKLFLCGDDAEVSPNVLGPHLSEDILECRLEELTSAVGEGKSSLMGEHLPGLLGSLPVMSIRGGVRVQGPLLLLLHPMLMAGIVHQSLQPWVNPRIFSSLSRKPLLIRVGFLVKIYSLPFLPL